MRILLVITNSLGKNIGFITSNFKILTLQEAITATQSNQIEGIHVVNTKKGNLIYIEGHAHAVKSKVEHVIIRNKRTIQKASKEFSVNPQYLTAILLDEQVRMTPFENETDLLGAIQQDTSIGIAQMKRKTAREIIKAGYYLKEGDEMSKWDLIHKLKDETHAIYFAAANIRRIIDVWSKKIDLSSQLNIVGVLYSKGIGTPHANPEPTVRSKQISQEFLEWAKLLLEESEDENSKK